MHGHHIVFKKGLGENAGKEASKEAKDILIFYGIDPYFGKENLAFAPNQGHPDAAMIEMRDRLKAVYLDDPTPAAKPRVVNLLVTFADEYFRKVLPGMGGITP